MRGTCLAYLRYLFTCFTGACRTALLLCASCFTCFTRVRVKMRGRCLARYLYSASLRVCVSHVLEALLHRQTLLNKQKQVRRYAKKSLLFNFVFSVLLISLSSEVFLGRGPEREVWW